jgi:hypothetical protein
LLHKARRMAIKYGYRSGLEHQLSLYLDEHKVKYDYENTAPIRQTLYYITASLLRLREGSLQQIGVSTSLSRSSIPSLTSGLCSLIVKPSLVRGRSLLMLTGVSNMGLDTMTVSFLKTG